MISQVAEQDEREVARPLKVLAELIKKDLADAESVGRPHYEAAAEKLIVARDGHFDGRLSQFYDWAEKQFGKNKATIRSWIVFGSSEHRKSFKNKEQFDFAPKSQGGLGKTPRPSVTRSEWAAPVGEEAKRARAEQRRLQEDEFRTRVQERKAEAQLGLRLISIGYKVLARELHPDKGGSREAMTRLNRVRDRLKTNV
jgi:hypothetical protein